MNESLFSSYWYRVENLKPMLRDSVAISRHNYRGQPWFVLRNRLNGCNLRFNAAAYALIGQMDGGRTVQEIWESAGQQAQDNAPTQDEVIRLLGRLHDADLVQSDILPSTIEMVRQLRGVPQNSWKQRVTNPFSMRFPLLNPDRFLDKWKFLMTPLLNRAVFMVWLSIVICAMVAAGLNWPELTGRLSDRLMSPHNLMLLWLVYPVVKIFHELGHAFAVKRWGGEVHEMGITLLALTPIPYVDASASASFGNKRRRVAVAAMGMAAELLLASIALFIWLNVESGLISALAYNVMLIAGVSTVLFNGNPLLRYDGYYILVDLIEIPNLGQRSTRYLGYLFRRYLLGSENAESPVTAPGEKGWFLFYGPAAFIYRMIVLVGLVWLVSNRFFVIGILIAVWGVVSLMILPALRTLHRFLSHPEVGRHRIRLVSIGCGLALGISMLLFVFPYPLWTTSQGVVWLPEQSAIRAGTDCEILEIVATPEETVAENAPLVKGGDAFLTAQIMVHKSRLEELYASYNAQPLHKRVERKMLQEEITLVKSKLQHAEAQQAKLLIRSPAPGRFILLDADNLSGRFVRKGELLGYILEDDPPTVRAMVSQNDIGLVRERITQVEVRLSQQLNTVWRADIQRISPSADYQLPSAALGTGGGGYILTDPTDPEALRALNSYFQIDVQLPEEVEKAYIGGRVHVRIGHGAMPLAMQWYRRLRQLFIRNFYV